MIVSKDGKEAIFSLDKMDKNSSGEFSTEFIYDELVVIALNGAFDMIYHIAANKNGHWGWIDWKTGEKKRHSHLIPLKTFPCHNIIQSLKTKRLLNDS